MALALRRAPAGPAQVQRSSPLLKGITFLAVAGQRAYSPRSIAGKPLVGAVGSTTKFAGSPIGNAWNFSFVNTSNIDFGTSNQPINGNGDFTVLVYANPASATPTGAVQRAFGQRDTSAFNQTGMLMFNTSAGASFPGADAGKVCIYGNDPAFNTFAADSAAILPSYPLWQTFAGRKIGAQPDIFVAGLKKTTASQTGTSSSYYSSGMQTYIGNCPNGLDQGCECSIGLVAVWNRGLTDQEIFALRDPFVLLRQTQSPRRYWAKTASGGTVFNQTVAASTLPVSTVRRAAGKPLAAACTPGKTITRVAGKAIAAATSPLASLRRAAGTGIAAVCRPVANVTKAIPRTIAAACHPAATVSAIKVVLKALDAACHAVASLRRSAGKTVFASVAPVGSLVRAVATFLTALVRPRATVASEGGTRAGVGVIVPGGEGPGGPTVIVPGLERSGSITVIVPGLEGSGGITVIVPGTGP